MPVTENKDEAKLGAADRQQKRRERIQSLMGPRAAPVDKAAQLAKAAQRGGKEIESSRENPARQRILKRVYTLLTSTPADATGTVAGTPFSMAGVLKLMHALKGRATDESKGGAKAAAGLLKFLEAPAGDENQVHGVSVEKLQRLAKLADRKTGIGS